MSTIVLPSSVVRETGDYFKFNDSLLGEQLPPPPPQESLIWLSYNVKVQEEGHTTLHAVV